jgi:hypothetical protein
MCVRRHCQRWRPIACRSASLPAPIEAAVRDVEPTVLGCIAGKGTAAVPWRNAILLLTFVFAMSIHQAGDNL